MNKNTPIRQEWFYGERLKGGGNKKAIRYTHKLPRHLRRPFGGLHYARIKLLPSWAIPQGWTAVARICCIISTFFTKNVPQTATSYQHQHCLETETPARPTSSTTRKVRARKGRSGTQSSCLCWKHKNNSSHSLNNL